MNKDETSANTCQELTQSRSGPVRYELIDRDGKKVPMTFGTAQAAGEHAKAAWPDQEQDEDRMGKGWDVQVAGLPLSTD